MVELNFDARSVEPNDGSFEPIPAGWYNAMIDQSELKPTKDGQGAYLELRFSIIDGQYANRKLFSRLNIRNSNPVAQEIAFKDLSAIGYAVNVLDIQRSDMLHGIPLKLKVKVRPADNQYEASNDITSYKNINEQVGGAASAQGQAQAQLGFTGAAQQAPQQGFQQQQPWQQQTQPPVQNVQQVAPQQVAPQQQTWQQPQAQQPWQQGAQQAQQPWQQGAQQAQQPWQQQQVNQPQQSQQIQQPAQQQPSEQVQTATPPWMQNQQQGQGSTPPWNQPQG